LTDRVAVQGHTGGDVTVVPDSLAPVDAVPPPEAVNPDAAA